MLHSPILDILAVLLPLGIGVGAFLLGKRLWHWPAPVLRGVVALTLAVLAGLAGTAFPATGDWAGPLLSHLGGVAVPACWAALLQLGVVWTAPGRKLTSGFLATLAVFVGLVLLMENGGRLWWRYAASPLWQRRAGADGCLVQSSGTTCLPAAAVMLLHHYGIPASEGEMAYLANTSALGTDPYCMARALSLKARAEGWTATVHRTDYDACVRDGVPFLALVTLPAVGGHALFVEELTPEQARIIDPLSGVRSKVQRPRFMEWWGGKIIRLDKQ
jgi:hypothetical protein